MTSLELSGAQLVGGSLFLDRIDGPTGTPRLGQRWGLTSLPNMPCFIQVCAPETLGFDEPFLDLNLDNPIPSILLGPEHLGMLFRAAMFSLDENGRWDGTIRYSNVVGPVLHASDPLGTWVTTSGELIDAMARNDPLIVLPPGTSWSATVFNNRNLTSSTITTPQDNPARIADSFGAPGRWLDVTVEGIIFRSSATWSRTSGGGGLLRTGTSSDGIRLRGCKQIGDDVPPSVYRAVPPTLLQSPYRNNGLAPGNPPGSLDLPYEPNGSSGMRFVPEGFDLYRSRNVFLEGHYCRNTRRAFTLPYSSTIRDLRIDAWYGDCIQINGAFSSSADRFSIRGMYCSKVLGIYDEQDATNNTPGSGDAPHPDPFQITDGSTPLVEIEVDRYVSCIGDTRGHAFGGTITNIIAGAPFHNGRIRNMLVQGQGPISTYLIGKDVSIDRTTKIQFGATGGGGATRFGGGQFDDECRVSRSIMREAVTRVGTSTSRYYVEDESETNVGAGITAYVFGDPSSRAPGLAQLALLARPRSPYEDRGALLESGHMRPYEPFPVFPAVLALTPQAGGFSISLGMVSGALRYELRYRPTGSTGAWTLPAPSLTPNFTVTGLPSGVSYDVQRFVKTAAGLSRWSDVTPVITL